MTRYVIHSTRRTRPTLDLDSSLNDGQRAVVLGGHGPMLVVAGAGTGKTRTLTYRAAHLIADGLDPQHLLLCTFTNRAAKEMVRRVENLLQADVGPRWAGTFHHVANLALRRYASHVGLDETYTILDREDARELMASCLADDRNKPRTRRLPSAAVLQHIASTMTNCQLPLVDTVCREAPRFVDMCDEIAEVLDRFSARKTRLALVDYDDLLRYLKQLLAQDGEPTQELAGRFRHVLVDEYQDTNRIQAQIIDICASVHGNLTAVGDDAQSIYSFRGARIENMVDFTTRYPDAQVFKLETNYRSVPEVLRLANASIRHNHRQLPKQLCAKRSPGMSPVLAPLVDVYQQAAFIVQRILELSQEEDISLAQMAVLYRAHAHSMELQIELARRGIPFSVRSGLRFFEQAHIKDAVAYLRLVHNPADLLAWQRVLRTWSGIGRRSAEHVLDTLLNASQGPVLPAALLNSSSLAQRLPSSARPAAKRLAALFDQLEHAPGLSEMIQVVLDAHYREYAETTFPNAATRVDDLLQLSDYARHYGALEQFLSELSLVAGFAAEAIAPGLPPEDSLTLSTVHQAKGLEWQVVFVIGLAEGRFPQPMAVRTPETLEEERRLFYVAATRAKDQLYLCHPRFEEPKAGPRRLLRLSRFIDELGHSGSVPYERWEIAEC